MRNLFRVLKIVVIAVVLWYVAMFLGGVYFATSLVAMGPDVTRLNNLSLACISHPPAGKSGVEWQRMIEQGYCNYGGPGNPTQPGLSSSAFHWHW